MKVTVIGAAGGIGQALSLLLKNQLPAGSELALYDVNKTTPGVAVDISHIPTSVAVTGYADDITPALKDADIVVLTATIGGLVAGADRSTLFDKNAALVVKLLEAITVACPQACVGMITNPVNSLLPIAARVLEKAGVYDRRKLFGITTLDVIRSETFLAEKIGKKSEDVKVPVVGGHSEATTVPLFSQAGGSSLSAENLQALTSHVQRAYADVVEAKAGGGSATLSMAQAASRFILSLASALQGEKDIVECAYVEGDGQYARFFAQQVRLGAQGVEECLPVGTLNDGEAESVEIAVRQLEQDIELGESFAI